MAKVTALAFVAVLALHGHADLVVPAQFTDAELASAVITMSRQSNGGFGYADPGDLRNGATFTVGVYGDGTVTYIGSSGVGMIGTLTHKIPSDTARALVEEFLRAEFFNFKDSYRGIEVGGMVASRPHADETTLSLSLGTRRKTISAKLGVPYRLRQLERSVEEATDVRRYTGKPPRPVGPHTLSGRILNNHAAPLAGVSITLAGDTFYNATTDADGRYQISEVFPDDYTLIATAAGFVTAVSKRKVQAEAPLSSWNPVLTRHEGPAELLDLQSQLNLHAGQTTNDCGQYLLADNDGKEADTATLELFLECAAVARKNGRPFRVVVQQKGTTSWSAQGLAGGPSLSQFLFTFSGGRLSWQFCFREPVSRDVDGRAQITCG